MAFIQIIELRTERIDEFEALEDEWERSTEGKRTARRSILARDRNDPTRHLAVVFFDSYESAMENSNLPETATFARQAALLLTSEMAFTDLDVIADRS